MSDPDYKGIANNNARVIEDFCLTVDKLKQENKDLRLQISFLTDTADSLNWEAIEGYMDYLEYIGELKAENKKLRDALDDSHTIDGKECPVKKFEALFNSIKENEPYAHFEVGYNRKTGYMAWICSRCIDDDPDRTVYACGQSDTLEKACLFALMDYENRNGSMLP